MTIKNILPGLLAVPGAIMFTNTPVLATQLDLELSVAWDRSTFIATDVAEDIAAAMNSSRDTWQVSINLQDFVISTPPATEFVASEGSGTFSIGIESTTPLAIGVEPATGEDSVVSDDLAVYQFNDYDFDQHGAVTLNDRSQGFRSGVEPLYHWYFIRTLDQLLPEMESVSNEDLIQSLSQPGTKIGVQEEFSIFRYARFLRTGSATITSVSIDGVAVSPESATCRAEIVSEWPDGYVGLVHIKNETATNINGWYLNFDLNEGDAITNFWSSDIFAGPDAFTASNLQWNSVIEPGQEINFGFQVEKDSGEAASILAYDGVCH